MTAINLHNLLLVGILPLCLGHLVPGASPVGFAVETLTGRFIVNTTHGAASLPLVVMAYDSSDAFSRTMWHAPKSLEDFVTTACTSAHYLVASYSDNARLEVQGLQAILAGAVRRGADNGRQPCLQMERFHFAVQPASSLPAWLPGLLQHWRSPRREAVFSDSSGWQLKTERLDPQYGWILPPSTAAASAPVVPVVGACNSTAALSAAAGAWALVMDDDISGSDEETACRYTTVLSHVEGANAIGALLAAAPGEDVKVIHCASLQECSTGFGIPATMVPRHSAEAVQARVVAGQPVEVAFAQDAVPGFFAALNSEGRLAEVGWEKFPTLMTLGWTAQWLDYVAELHANLSRPALVVPVFDHAEMGPDGITATVPMPPRGVRAIAGGLELDMALGCPGTVDADCPIWDHVIQLFVCCDDPTGQQPPCDACPVTQWFAASGRPFTGPAASKERRQRELIERQQEPPLCGRELGRWITPFRRRVGRWLTDVSELAPLLNGDTCRFHMQSCPWAGTWQPSLSLRFLPSSPGRGLRHATTPQHGMAVAAGLQQGSNKVLPRVVALPFAGGNFDARYNGHAAFEFGTPPGVRRAVVTATITGHGSDNNNCAEFCPTQHVFVINGINHTIGFDDAGTLWGCANKVPMGVEPNEHGTWQYGRNGWCDGQQVDPWVVDITAALHSSDSSAKNSLQYLGLFEGGTPHPTTTPGYIMMQSNLVFYD